MSHDDIATIDDPQALVSVLDEMWRTNPPLSYRHEPLKPLAHTGHDQESVTVNPYWEIVRMMPGGTYWERAEVDGYACRVGRDYIVSHDQLTKTFGWAIPTPSDIAWIADIVDGRGVVEIGAGTGYWAWQLSQAFVEVDAFDLKPGADNTFCCATQYHPVHAGGAEKAGEYPTRALLLCWPPYESPMAADALLAYQGDTVISIGEPDGGCTGDEDFHRILAAEWDHLGDAPKHVTFSGIHCYVSAYRRKVVAS